MTEEIRVVVRFSGSTIPAEVRPRFYSDLNALFTDALSYDRDGEWMTPAIEVAHEPHSVDPGIHITFGAQDIAERSHDMDERKERMIADIQAMFEHPIEVTMRYLPVAVKT